MIVARIVKQLFPDSGIIALHAEDVAPHERFFVIPGTNGPRWVIPQDPIIGLPVLEQWKPYGILSFLKWNIIKLAYRGRGLSKFPKIMEVGISGIHDKNNWGLGVQGASRHLPVIYIGTPGPAQKAVAIFVNCQHLQPAYVIKVAIGPHASSSILYEASILEKLAREKPGVAPNLLYQDDENGVGVQEALNGRATGRCLTLQHIECLKSLRIENENTTLQFHVEGLRVKLRSLSDNNILEKRVLNRVFEVISDKTRLPAFWVHGDFAPYNCKANAEKEIILLDWEDAFRGGLPCYDIHHFINVQKYLFGNSRIWINKWVESKAIQKYMKDMHVPNSIMPKLELFYKTNEIVKRLLQNSKDKYAAYLCGQLIQEIRKYEH